MTSTPDPGHRRAVPQRRLSTETKASVKTTELIVYVGAVLAVVITALVVGRDGHGIDPVSAQDALRYITWLTIGYMISRGLAKSGSRQFYDESDDTLNPGAGRGADSGYDRS